MIGRARCAAALAALVLMPLVAITNTSPAAAQTSGRIDLVAQTAFVGDDPATIDLRVIAPADSTIRIQIFEALTTREDIRASYTGLGEQRPFSNFICDLDEPLDEAHCQLNSTKEIFSIEIPDEEIGEILRINQGALPVVITLEDNNGEIIDRLITHLLVLEEQRRPTLHVAFIADLSAPLAIQPDQTINLDTQNLFARAERIAERNEIPITVALQPETLQALAISGSEQLTEFTELIAERPVLNAPWVDLDEEAWRLTGDTTLIADQYSYGADVISEMLGRGPTTISKLDADATIETLALLRSNGTQAVLILPNQITGRTTDSSEFAPFQLRDATGTALTAIDTSLRQTLNHADPELAGHRALTELAIEAADATVDKAILFDFDQLEPAALEVLLDGINERSNLRTSPLTRALQVPVARDTDGQPVQAALTPTQAPDLSQRAADIGVTRGTVDAYASMVAPARTPITALETLMAAAASSSLSDEQSASYTLSAFEAVLAGTANITIEPAERITLTDRQANLRITIRNGQPLPITVDLLLSAEKLRFSDGERLSQTLVPGDNEITVRVETLASGDARVTVAITSPGGQLELHEGVIDIRSTAISGLGLVISIIALIVLGGWWVRTIRRVRRNRAAATVAATDQTADAEATTAEASADEQSNQTRTNQTQPTQPTQPTQQNQEEL